MEQAPENGKESSYSAHANGMNEYWFIVVSIVASPVHYAISSLIL
jgi:hypothetical protein